MNERHCQLAMIAGGMLVGAAVAAAIDAFLVEPLSVELSRHSLPIPDLPAEWEGARVIQLTDLHYGDPWTDRLFRQMVRDVNALHPDLILITGDFIQRRRREVGPCAEHLRGLKARYGVLGVLGDHDCNYYTQAPQHGIVEALTDAGIRLLRNEQLELPGGLRIAGTEPTTHKIFRADLRRTLNGSGPPHLLMSHSPDMIVEAAEAGVSILLSGHTHGGQVVVPFFGPPVTHTHVGRPHASGWSQRKGTRLYTCRGLASHASLRFLCRPEIALFTLSRAE
jgi:predicted MPP superfamily phosphohydrolase